MDSLRITLLVLGCLFILGIYLWEIFSKPAQRKNSDILDAVDDYPESEDSPLFSVPSSRHQTIEFNAEVADLGGLLTRSRNESKVLDDIPRITPITENTDELSDNVDLNIQTSDEDYEQLSNKEASSISADVEISSVVDEQDIYPPDENSTDIDEVDEETSSDTVSDATHVYEDILVLHIASPRHTLFNGLSISKAADEVGMIYGHMNVFHHFGPGKLHSGQPLFSMANMYEPGSFDLGKMADLNTKGIAMFMYSPASIDPGVVFELFLNTTQRLSKYLGGEIYTVEHKPLNNSEIKLLRERAVSLAE